MNTIFKKVKSFFGSLTRKSLSTEEPKIVSPPHSNEEKSSTVSLYEHRLIDIEEDVVNRMLRNRLQNHWLLHSVTLEFENNNNIFMMIITKMGQVITLHTVLEDLWFDDYTSSFRLKVDIANIDMGGFICNAFVHILGNGILSILGTFFNPFELGSRGSTVRVEKNGIFRFDLVPESRIKDFIPLPEREVFSRGPILLTNAKTSQSVIHLDYYAFHDEVDTFSMVDIPLQTSWFRSIDIAAVLLLPIGVWISFVILHHYLPTQELQFSFSTYFLISVGILILSFLIMNIPRYLYMYFDTRKKWQSAFVHNNIKIQMRKLQRRIVTQQAALESNKDSLDDIKYQEHIKYLLLQIRDKRFLAQRLTMADEDRERKQKVKFIIAYIGCTLLEWILLVH